MPDIGQYVIVRSRDQGCVCGEYVSHVGREVVVRDARQLYRWDGNRLTLFDVARLPGPVRLSAVVPDDVVVMDACGIIPTSPEVEAMLRTAKAG